MPSCKHHHIGTQLAFFDRTVVDNMKSLRAGANMEQNLWSKEEVIVSELRHYQFEQN